MCCHARRHQAASGNIVHSSIIFVGVNVLSLIREIPPARTKSRFMMVWTAKPVDILHALTRILQSVLLGTPIAADAAKLQS